jgi:hypothetical protein
LRAHLIVKCRAAAGVGMGNVSASDLQQALDAPFLVEPSADLGVEDRHCTGALAWGRVLVKRFAEHARDGVAVMADKGGNLDIAPAFLIEVMNGCAIHKL